MTSISDSINKLRKEKKVSQRELANKIEMSFRGLQVALDKDDFKVSTLEKIAKALQVDISYFFNEGGNVAIGHGIKQSVGGKDEIKELRAEIEKLSTEIKYLKEKVKDKEDLIEALRGK